MKTGEAQVEADREEDEDEQPERLSSEDAWLFPVVSAAPLSFAFFHTTKCIVWFRATLRSLPYSEVLWEGVDQLATPMVLYISWRG